MKKKIFFRRAVALTARLVKIYIFPLFPFIQRTLLPAAARHRRWIQARLQSRYPFLPTAYDRWLKLEAQRHDEVANSLFPCEKPLISLVMPVYNVRPAWLEAAVESVRNQSYPHWELCIADDCSTDSALRPLLNRLAQEDSRIRVRFLAKNRGIAGASQAALEMTSGEYVGLLDNDDELAPCALAEVALSLADHPEADLVYSDEDKITPDGRRYDPFFKPDFSPDTLRSYNYICHFSVIRRERMLQVGGFRSGYDGSQDYDLLLRVTEQATSIVHIPKILYHWRAVDGSVGQDGRAKMYAYDSAKKALADHLVRLGRKGTVQDGLFLGSYHIRYELRERPDVTIIIPTKDKVEVLRRCIDSILAKTTYENYTILIVDNGSRHQETFRYYSSFAGNKRVRIIQYDKPFNFSAINNYARQHCTSEYLLFLNNDTEIITPDWLEEMLGLGYQDRVGVVGCLLLYGNDTVQHGGVIVGIGGVAGHAHKFFAADEEGYFGRLHIVQNLSAVTGACMLVRKSVFDEVDGFSEELSHAFNDVDLCLKVREKGYLVVYTPFARAYHHESFSRGLETSGKKRERFKREIRFMQGRWGKVLRQGDPYYNPNLTLVKEDFSLATDEFLFS